MPTAAVAEKPPAAPAPAPAAAAPAQPAPAAPAAEAAPAPAQQQPAEPAAAPEGGSPAPAAEGGDGDGAAAAEAAAAAVPETAEGYELNVPDLGFKDAKGEPIKTQIDANDPTVGKFRGWAKKYNLPQGAINELMSDVYGPLVQATVEGQREQGTTRQSQGFADLGAGDVQKGKDYGKRVFRSALAALGDDQTHDRGLLEAMTTPGAVKAIEALISSLSNEGSVREQNRGGSQESKLEKRISAFYGDPNKKGS